jgi:hypothetical protein
MGDLTTVQAADLAAMAKELGASGVENSKVIMDELKINYEDEDDSGTRLDLGHVFVKGSDKKYFYAKSFTFRPLSQMHQYTLYDAQEKKMACKSRLLTDFFEEARDTKGTLRCGKPSSKEMRDMTEEQRKKYSGVKNERQLRGLVSYTGVSSSGEEKTYENHPVLMRLKGQNNYRLDEKGRLYSPFETQFLKQIPRGSSMWNFALGVVTKRRKSAATGKAYYTFEYSPDFGSPLPIDKDIFDTITMIKQIIDDENAYVDGEYYKAIKGDVYEAEASQVLDQMHESLDADYEDVA